MVWATSIINGTQGLTLRSFGHHGQQEETVVLKFNVAQNFFLCFLPFFLHFWQTFRDFNPLTPMSDQDRIFPYNINIILTR